MYSAPPPPYSIAKVGWLPNLLGIPPSILLSILDLLPLPTLIFTLKPVSKQLYILSSRAARERKASNWDRSIGKAGISIVQLSERSRMTSTGVFNQCNDPFGYNSPRREPYDPRDWNDDDEVGPKSLLDARWREARVFDLWVASCARLELDRSESVLFVDSEDRRGVGDDGDDGRRQGIERDIFGLMQPKARYEDLVITRGQEMGWAETYSLRTSGGEQYDARHRVQPEDIKVELSTKSAKLLLPVLGSSGRPVWKAIVEVERRTGDPFEGKAIQLADEFGKLRWTRIERDRQTCYSFS